MIEARGKALTSIACPACGEEKTTGREQLTVADQAQQSLQYTLYQCESCASQFFHPRRSAPPDWYAAVGEYYGWRWEFDLIANELERQPCEILEVGCGEGILLERLSRRHRAWGLEFNQEAAAKARAKGLSVFSNVQRWRAENPSACVDILALFHVIEHFEDPEVFLDEAKGVLKRGGRLMLSIPNPDRFVLKIEQREWWDYPPHHLTRFSKAGIARLLERTGFTVERAMDQPLPEDFSNRVRGALYRALPIPKVIKGIVKLPLNIVLRPIADSVSATRRGTCTGEAYYVEARRL